MPPDCTSAAECTPPDASPTCTTTVCGPTDNGPTTTGTGTGTGTGTATRIGLRPQLYVDLDSHSDDLHRLAHGCDRFERPDRRSPG